MAPLATTGIAVPAFDTDDVLVRAQALDTAMNGLGRAGHEVVGRR